jgi:hypothetical protein
MRNADLGPSLFTLPDGRPYYGGFDIATFNCFCELNPDGQAGIYVIDNTSEGYNFSVTAQLRKAFSFGLTTYSKVWSESARTQIGVFVEVGQGNRFAGAGGNRYSFIYSGDVNGDGYGGNDLIYIPADQSDIVFDPHVTTGATPQQQWDAFDAFIGQDKYLSTHRGQIAERFGALNPMYQTIDLRVMQDFGVRVGGTRHGFQLSVDILNVGNLINSDWGVRKVASPAATSPLTMTTSPADDPQGVPHFNFTGPSATFVDDPSILSRWQIQIGVRYLFN